MTRSFTVTRPFRYCSEHCEAATGWLPLALSPPMLQLGQLRPSATSRNARRTVGSHWLMCCQLPAMHSKTLQPSTACAGLLNPSPSPHSAASCMNVLNAVLKCAFIANLSPA